MKHAAILLLLTLTPSCAGLGPTASDAETEATISTIESVARTTGDAIVPGLGVAAAIGAGFLARAIAKKRKAAKVAP